MCAQVFSHSDVSAEQDRRLVVMDVDSTLIDEEVIDMLGEEAGIGERVAAITERAMRGELDFDAALHERVALLEGMDASVLDTVYDRCHFTRGALDLVRTCHERGWKVGVVSGGFHEIADRLVADAGIDFCTANSLEIHDGVLTGRLVGDIVTKQTKLHSLRLWAERMGIDMAHTVAIGDGANDIPMIQAAGVGIAFCAKPKTQQAAPHVLNERDLMRVFDIVDEQ
ncbi:phosphoserine phosphatase SerB [Bifidobacterium primatium]|uniref:phosphoserine phosphatase n=1 Tax=Bifidobacterium primatium TaxID=2045438 RepID=A0A2M9H7I6_9BIFI|nr:phosphoserine phosphatase SerB [Bifidobacterium primatium]PJM72781.1 phosphoserine phosphatase SerB [Bifidobacterium primatium]